MTPQASVKATVHENLAGPVQVGLDVCLLRVMFGIPDDQDEERLYQAKVCYLGETYTVKEVAADLGISPFSVYKMLDEQRAIRFSTVLKILDYIRWKNPSDTRLVDFIVGHAGMVSMPKEADPDVVDLVRAVIAKAKRR